MTRIDPIVAKLSYLCGKITQKNRSFVARQSRDLLFIKLWAITLKKMPDMENSRRPSLKPLAFSIA